MTTYNFSQPADVEMIPLQQYKATLRERYNEVSEANKALYNTLCEKARSRYNQALSHPLTYPQKNELNSFYFLKMEILKQQFYVAQTVTREEFYKALHII